MRHLLSALCLLAVLHPEPTAASQDKTLPEFAVWQAGTPVEEVEKPEPPLLELLADGRTAFALFDGGRIEFHDLTKRERTRLCNIPEDSTYEAISPDGKWILTRSANQDVWELHDLQAAQPKLTRKWKFVAPPGSVMSFYVTPNHKRMLTFSDHNYNRNVSMWDIATGNQQWTQPVYDLIGFRRDHAELVVQIKRLEVGILDTRSGKPLDTIKFKSDVSASDWGRTFQFLPGRDHILGPGADEEDSSWIIIDLANKVELPARPRPTGAVSHWALQPTGRSVAFGFADGQVLFNEWPAGKFIKRLRPPKDDEDKYTETEHCAFSEDGSIVLLSTDENSILRLDPETGNYTDRYAPWAPPQPPTINSQAFAFIDPSTLVTVSGRRQLAIHRRRQSPEPTAHVPGKLDVREVLVTPDGHRAAVVCRGTDPDEPDDETKRTVLHLLDVQEREWNSITLGENADPFRFSPDGQSIYSVTKTDTDRLFEIRDAATGKRTDAIPAPQGFRDEANKPPNGQFVPVGTTLFWIPRMGRRQIFNPRERKFEVRDRTKRYTDPDEVRLPGGRLTIRASNYDVEVTDTLEDAERHTIRRSGSYQWVYPEAVHPNGRYMLIDGQHEGSYLHLLDVVGRKYLYSFPCSSYTNYDFTANGKLMAAENKGVVTIWDIEAIIKAKSKPKPVSDKQIAAAWQKLHKNAAAIETLVLHPAQALTYARKNLKPAEPFSADQANNLLTDLNNDDVEVRLKAFRKLKQLDIRIKSATETFLKTNSTPEATRLSKSLLSTFERNEHPSELYADRVIEVLHHLRRDLFVTANPRLRLLPMAILSRLARGPAGAALTEEAKLEMTEPE